MCLISLALFAVLLSRSTSTLESEATQFCYSPTPFPVLVLQLNFPHPLKVCRRFCWFWPLFSVKRPTILPLPKHRPEPWHHCDFLIFWTKWTYFWREKPTNYFSVHYFGMRLVEFEVASRPYLWFIYVGISRASDVSCGLWRVCLYGQAEIEGDSGYGHILKWS